jgi:hypothetical protein
MFKNENDPYFSCQKLQRQIVEIYQSVCDVYDHQWILKGVAEKV